MNREQVTRLRVAVLLTQAYPGQDSRRAECEGRAYLEHIEMRMRISMGTPTALDIALSQQQVEKPTLKGQKYEYPKKKS